MLGEGPPAASIKRSPWGVRKMSEGASITSSMPVRLATRRRRASNVPLLIIAQPATLMGHKDPNILHNHYKALVLKTEAEKFWNLRPETVTAVNDTMETPIH
jgi:hypothetical protein